MKDQSSLPTIFDLGKLIKPLSLSFPGGSDGNESARSAGDLSLIPGLGRFPGGHGNPPVFLPGESPWTKKPHQ